MTCRVAMISPCESGGHPTYVRAVMTAAHDCAAQHGISVELLSSLALGAEFGSAPYPVHCVLPRYPVRSVLGRASYRASQFLYPMRVDASAIAWLARHPEIDGVHFQDYFNLGSAFRIGDYRKTGKWLAFTVHNIHSHRYPPMGRAIMDAMARHTWRSCHALFVHSEDLKRELAEFLGESHPPIYVTPHGVFGAGCVVYPADLAKRLARKRLLFFGAVRANKGLHIALDAIAHLPGFSLTIAGGGNAETDYWKNEGMPRIETLRKAGREIELIAGYTPESELPALWARHSAVLLPYTGEFRAQSGVLFLAIGHGTPAITSGAGGMAEILRAHPVGERMLSSDAVGLADAVHALYSRAPSDLAGALNHANQVLSWKQSAHRLMDAWLETHRLHRAALAKTLPIHARARIECP